MTVQELITLTAPMIGSDYASYSTNYGQVTQIVTEVARLGIGVNPRQYSVTLTGDETEDASNTGYTAVALPADLTADSQIISVTLYDEVTRSYIKTKSSGGTLYLLVPVGYAGEVGVEYAIKVTPFTAPSNVIPLDDDACYGVVCYGLAWLLSLNDANEYTSDMLGKYESAKATWRRRDYNKPRQVRDVYGF